MRTRINRPFFRKTIIAGGGGTTAPTGFWNLNEASNSTRNDSCSTPANLTSFGTTTQVTGKIGFAAQSASTFNYLNNGSAAKLNTTGSFSLAGWFKLDNAAGGAMAINGSGGSSGWKITASTTALVITTYQSLGVFTSYTKTISISTGTWYFVVGYFNGSQFGLSLDGGSFTTGAGTACAGSNGISLLGDGSNSLQGNLDEFGFWNGTVLTSTEKDDLYNSGNGKTFNGSAWV